AVNPRAGFDLECDDVSIVTFKNEVDLIGGRSTKVADRDWRVPPADLFQDLTDGERLDQMTVVTQHGRVRPGDLFRSQPGEPSHDASANEMKLGLPRHPRSQCRAPGR